MFADFSVRVAHRAFSLFVTRLARDLVKWGKLKF